MKRKLHIVLIFTLSLVWLMVLQAVCLGETYYVATNGPNASDDNLGTEEGRPWKTLTKAANTAQAGDTVLVKAGIYNETLAPANSGAPGAMITFKAYPGEECQGTYTKTNCQVVIDGEYTRPTVDLTGRSYIRIEGFEIKRSAETMHGVTLYNSYGIEIVNNHIHHNDVYTPNYWEGSSGINIDGDAGDILIKDNDIHHNYKNGISPYYTPSLSNFRIIDNDIHHNGNDGIQQGGGSNWLIEGNRIYVWGGHMAIAHPDGIQLFRSIDGLIISNNIFWDQHQNITLQPLTGEVMENVEIYNNLFYRDEYDYEYQKGILLHMQGGSMNNVKIYGNTIYGMHFGILLAEADPGALTGVEIRNNIIAEITGLGLGEDISSPDINSDYNLFFNEGRIDWDGAMYYSLSAYQSDTGQDLHSIGADPEFVNPSSFDFHLQPTSPAIDAGDPNLATLFTLPTPFLDLDGNPRLYGMGYDIGAYEYTLLPRVVISAQPEKGYLPLKVLFGISELITPNGEIETWKWDFGDGTTSQEKEPSHTYTSPGEYTATLIVTDIEKYQGRAQTHIIVLEKEKEFQELLIGCYNNVINPIKGEEALIWVELPRQARVKVDLYNTRGNRIRKLVDEERDAETCKYYWNGKDDNGSVVGSGLYFVHIQVGDYKKTKKIVVVK